MARRYGVRPSALLAEANPYRAYCIDEACLISAIVVAQPARAAARHVDGHGPLVTGKIGRAT